MSLWGVGFVMAAHGGARAAVGVRGPSGVRLFAERGGRGAKGGWRRASRPVGGRWFFEGTAWSSRSSIRGWPPESCGSSAGGGRSREGRRQSRSARGARHGGEFGPRPVAASVTQTQRAVEWLANQHAATDQAAALIGRRQLEAAIPPVQRPVVLHHALLLERQRQLQRHAARQRSM